jgi:hypothetical protein
LAEAAEDARWNHTAAVVAMVLHAATDMSKHKYDPSEFHPLRQRERKAREAAAKLPTEDIGVLKAIFVDNRPMG